MTRKNQAITLSLQEHDKAQLEALAQSFGITWGDRPNISSLIKAIAQRKILLTPNNDWTSTRINALNQARIALIDSGQIELALEIAHLLLERSEPTIPLRNELTVFIQTPIQPWRIQIETYIRRNKAFRLSYQDAREQLWQFTIRHAQITLHEDRQYLDCWCEETEGNKDLPELIHNRCLRIDRITDPAISPVTGNWRSSLDTIPIEMHLYGGLAFAYQSKSNQDTLNEWHPELPEVRRVTRQISNTFWFTREILRYGKDCEIVTPDRLRDRIRKEINSLHQRYSTAQPDSEKECLNPTQPSV
jgi:hypothetical protein